MKTSMRHLWLALAATAMTCAAGAAHAGTVDLTGGAANGVEAVTPAEITMGIAASRAAKGQRLPGNPADVAAKVAADAAYDRAAREGRAVVSQDAISLAADGRSVTGPRQPSAYGSYEGKFDTAGTPPDTTGATGTKRYIQLVNSKIGIYDRSKATPLSSNTLKSLAGFTADTFDPQIIWDSTTNRFYYMMDAVVSATDNRLAFGFSKSSAPSSTADFCKYYISYGSEFPDYPKLGDNSYFMLAGVNVYDASGNFTRSDVIATPKPAGTSTIWTCPTFAQLTGTRAKIFQDIRDSAGDPVFSPTPANQIDSSGYGYVVGRAWSIPAKKLLVMPVTGTSTGAPTRGTVRAVTIPDTPVPPNARQPGISQLLDTSDTRMTQAVLARNPSRKDGFSLWTQQTIANDTTGSQIQYYEMRPYPSMAPVLLRTGKIASSGSFLFNAAISPDRRVNNVDTGQNFVVGYSASSRTNNINPKIMAASSIDGASVTFKSIKNGYRPYWDFSCTNAGDICRWGDYSGAAPDPAPQNGATSAVGITNQWSPDVAMSATQANWRSWIAQVIP